MDYRKGLDSRYECWQEHSDECVPKERDGMLSYPDTWKLMCHGSFDHCVGAWKQSRVKGFCGVYDNLEGRWVRRKEIIAEGVKVE